MAEDTWVLNEKRMDERGFLDHCLSLMEERTRMLEFELNRFRDGLLVCVYDQPDRLQHMFWRVEDTGHPAYREDLAKQYGHVIGDVYERLDHVVGKVRAAHPDADLLVMSDHGCKSFRRAFHVNRWLAERGFLAHRSTGNANDPDQLHFEGVDWSKTQAYALGLVGIFINLRGRESQGSVTYGQQREKVIAELVEQLMDFKDPETGERVVNRAIAREAAYRGPHIPDAPDLILAYNAGYRASWQTALGGIPAPTLEDNLMAWSGDHCIDASLVPGVLLSTRKLGTSTPHIMDIAPSVLSFFGLSPDTAHEGASFWAGTA
jgi:predicted AlkP superfamily phosphohydrolase/phosphomutase